MAFISVGTAILGSAVIGAGASLLGANKQAGAANRAIDVSNEQYRQSRADLEPWRKSGVTANNRLMDLLGLSTPESRSGLTMPTREQFTGRSLGRFGGSFDQAGYDKAMSDYNAKLSAASVQPEGFGSLLKTFSPGDLTQDPGYQFGLTEGEKALNRAASSRGMYFAPSTSKELSQYNQDYAGTKYNEAFNRDQIQKGQTYSFLSGTSGAGENAAGQTANLGSQNAANVGNLVTSGGAAQAAGLVGAANAGINAAGQYINWGNQSRLLDLIGGGRSPTGNYIPNQG